MNEAYLKTKIRKILEAPPSNAIVWSFAGSPFCKGGFPDTVVASHIFNGLVEYKFRDNRLSALQRQAIIRFKARKFPVLCIRIKTFEDGSLVLQAEDTDGRILDMKDIDPRIQNGHDILTFYVETWKKWIQQ